LVAGTGGVFVASFDASGECEAGDPFRQLILLIEDKERITPDAIDAENNAKWRRVMLEIFSFDRYIAARGAKPIAENECLGLPRQLFEIDLRGERVRALRVVNGRSRRTGARVYSI
jgi:hypothetical protein